MKERKLKKFLLYSLVGVAFGVLVSNFFGEDVAIVFTSWLYIPTAGTLVVLSIIMSIRSGLTGTQGISWILFAGTAILWLAGEMTWNVYELVYEIDPYPSEADYFWLAGFAVFFAFLIFYLKPFRRKISKKILFLSIAASMVLLIPALYLSFDPDPEISDIEQAVGLSYPIVDSIVLVPALIGMALFLRGHVNFLWTLICLAIFCFVAADTSFLFLQLEDSYYSGHPMEILYHWAYIFFAFGVYYHIKLFEGERKVKMSKDP